jgi:hypothetical protein
MRRFLTIVDPRVQKDDCRRSCNPSKVGPGFFHSGTHYTLSESDYISVPAVAVAGTWPASSLVPFEQLANLAVLRNELSRR